MKRKKNKKRIIQTSSLSNIKELRLPHTYGGRITSLCTASRKYNRTVISSAPPFWSNMLIISDGVVSLDELRVAERHSSRKLTLDHGLSRGPGKNALHEHGMQSTGARWRLSVSTTKFSNSLVLSRANEAYRYRHWTADGRRCSSYLHATG